MGTHAGPAVAAGHHGGVAVVPVSHRGQLAARRVDHGHVPRRLALGNPQGDRGRGLCRLARLGSGPADRLRLRDECSDDDDQPEGSHGRFPDQTPDPQCGLAGSNHREPPMYESRVKVDPPDSGHPGRDLKRYRPATPRVHVFWQRAPNGATPSPDR